MAEVEKQPFPRTGFFVRKLKSLRGRISTIAGARLTILSVTAAALLHEVVGEQKVPVPAHQGRVEDHFKD